MTSTIRHTAVWTGVPGLPGYSQFYQQDEGDVPANAQDGHVAIGGLFYSLSALIPDGVTVTVDPVYQVLTTETGEISSEMTVATPAEAVVGTYTGGWSGQVGVLIEWLTGEYVRGRRLRGRTYLVPLGSVGDQDGTLSTGTLAAVRTAALYITGASVDFVVWHRPINGVGGLSSPITGSAVRDHAAILRSRRI